MRKNIFLLALILFITLGCNESKIINIHSEQLENNNDEEYKWILKVNEFKNKSIKFEIIYSESSMNAGIISLLNSFKEKTKIDKYIEFKNEKSFCVVAYDNTISKIDIGEFYLTKVFRNKNELFFTKESFIRISDIIRNEHTITESLSALTAFGSAYRKNIELTIRYSGEEKELINLLINENLKFNKIISPILMENFRSIVGRTKKEDISTEKVQAELIIMSELLLKGKKIKLIDLKLID